MNSFYLKCRKENIVYLKSHKINVISTLPLLNKLSIVKEVDEIIDRCLILNVLIAVYYGFPKDKAIGWMKINGFKKYFNGDRYDFFSYELAGNVAKVRQMAESIQEFLRILQIKKKKEFYEKCDDDLVGSLPNLLLNEKKESFSDKIDKDLSIGLYNIIKELDLYYCLHWYCTNEELRGNILDYATRVYRKRYALEWIVSELDWNQISMDT